ncbi:hypothetical protein [Methanobrevibacter curvatus]|uniref:Uncharacterized protein n=1 Tax=Methanobrevibacter curvatus TaxID=49547 RepID=A0A166C4V8_9EURY|nr:hypothetical protein [Methanobrevibacter curvatus]KZX14130.1 hypothetical protein MBCUR_06060 [Methanobrevibacter curvatus]
MFKELKSIDLSSFTIMSTTIHVILGFILGIVAMVYSAIIGQFSIGSVIYPFLLAFSTVLICVTVTFLGTFLFNILSKKFTVGFNLEDGKIRDITPLPLAINLTIITAIFLILLYPIILLVLGVLSPLTAFLQFIPTLYVVFMIASFIANPIILLSTVIIVFIATFLGSFFYNQIALKINPIELDLNTVHGNRTQIDLVYPLKLALISGIVSAILSFIATIIGSIISGGNLPQALTSLIASAIFGFLAVFIIFLISAFLYNFIVKKSNIFEPVKVKLE